MGYPKYTPGIDKFCMSVTKLKPMTVCKSTKKKCIKILISELNPPVCKVLKELAAGGSKGSVPINFASKETMARLCPPPVCDCKPCSKSNKELIGKILLAFKIAFLAGSIIAFWYIGGFGPTWSTWNLKECIMNMYYSCKNIEFVYKNKCCPSEEEVKPPSCETSMSNWNQKVLCFFSGAVKFYDQLKETIHEDLKTNETCDTPPPQPPVKKKQKKQEIKVKEPAVSEECAKKKKCDTPLFNDLDPIKINCKNAPDYWCLLYKMRYDEDKCTKKDSPDPKK